MNVILCHLNTLINDNKGEKNEIFIYANETK